MMFVIIAFVSLTLNGCFNSESSKSSSPTPGSSPDSTTELQGSWETGCNYDIVYDESQNVTLTLSGSMYTVVISIYAQDLCLTPNLILEINETGNISIGSGITTQTNPEPAKKLNITTSTYSLTPRMQALVDGYNFISYCGLTTWALNVPMNITGLTCDSDQMPSAGDIYYTIYAISGGTTLYMGDEYPPYDGTSEAARPVDLDKTDPFIKQ